jgi:hypothetical protein
MGNFSDAVSSLKPGKYQHYKGQFYQLIGVARHSKTLEELLVYRALYHSDQFGDQALWVRPAAMFLESVDLPGQSIPRFKFIEAS